MMGYIELSFSKYWQKTCGRERTQNGSRIGLNLVKCNNLRVGTENFKAITLLLKWIHVAFYRACSQENISICFFFIELSAGRERTVRDRSIFPCSFINSKFNIVSPSSDFYLLIRLE